MFSKTFILLILSFIACILAKKGPKVTNQLVFTIEQKGNFKGDVVIGLFGGTVPKTAENFR